MRGGRTASFVEMGARADGMTGAHVFSMAESTLPRDLRWGCSRNWINPSARSGLLADLPYD